MKAVRVHNPGPDGALVYEDLEDPVAAPGQALVRMEAIGVNFADTFARRGGGPGGGTPPFNIGFEGAGTVVALGDGVTEVAIGDRIAMTSGPITYRELVAWPASQMVKLPDGIDTKQAAASMLQGMTAHYLGTSIWPLKPGDTCLVHAAAGGVGLLLTQLAKMRGARVIGTVSTPEKARAARAAGADDVIIYSDVDFDVEVKRLTDGRGVNVIFDSVGADTFLKGINCLQRRGMIALFGRASGVPQPVDLELLLRGGSLIVTHATMLDYIAEREELVQRATDIFNWVASGKLKLTIHEYPLRDAAKAHAALEHRETIGKLLLIP